MKLSPGTALLLTLLVPGSAHALMGRIGAGLLALVTCGGLFYAGVAIVGDRLWYMVLFEPFAWLEPLLRRVPLQLLPEAPNLGCSIVFSALHAPPPEGQPLWDWLRAIRIPVPNEHIGMFLSGSSGIVAALWAADAHWLAQGRVPHAPSPARAALLSWLIPGSGHVLAGQKDKGILMGAAVVIMFALGLLLSAGHGVDRPLRSAWWIPQSLFGGGTLFSTLVTGPWPEGEPARFVDQGVAMCAVAGLMNLVVMLDSYTVAEQRALRSKGAS